MRKSAPIFTRQMAPTVLCLALAATAAKANDIHFVTETYPPFNYMENNQIKGSSMDQVRLIMKEIDIPYSVEIMPWARALAMAEINTDFCVFTTVHNSERDQKLKWVEPLLKSRTILIRKAGSKVAPKSLEEAKAFTIGTQRGDFTEDLLKQNDFPKVDLATDLELGLKKLLSGRVDLMPVSEKYYAKLKHDGADVESVLTLSESIYAIACNRGFADATIARMQQALDRSIADGTQEGIFRTWGLETDEKTSGR